MSFFLLLNTEDILKNVGNQTVDVTNDFYSIFFSYYERQWRRQLSGYPHFLKCSAEEINSYRFGTTLW